MDAVVPSESMPEPLGTARRASERFDPEPFPNRRIVVNAHGRIGYSVVIGVPRHIEIHPSARFQPMENVRHDLNITIDIDGIVVVSQAHMFNGGNTYHGIKT